MSWTGRRWRRGGAIAATALGSALLVLPPLSPASAAEDVKVGLTQQAWFWSTNQKVTICLKDPALGACQAFILADGGPRGLAPVPPGTLAPISYGHLGVSMINGVSDMRSFVKFSLDGIPKHSTIKNFVVRMTVSKFSPAHMQYHMDAEAKPPASVLESFAQIQACPMAEPWGDGAAGDAPTWFSLQRPEIESQSTDPKVRSERNEALYDCGRGAVRGKLTPDGTTYVFDIASIAQQWIDGDLTNEGIALMGVPEGLSNSWVVELHGAPYSLTATTPGVPLPVPVPLPDAPDELLERNHYVSDAEQATVNVSYVAPAVVVPDDETDVTPQPGPTTTIVQQLPGPPLTIPGPPVPGGTTTQVIAVGPQAQVPVGAIDTPGWVFLAFPLGLLALGAMFGAVGKDDLTTAAVPIAGSRVAMMLRQRRLDA